MNAVAAVLDFVRELPAFAGALLGFAGVIITLIVNAYLARRQERGREAREAQALRIALIEELRIQKEALENFAQPAADAADATHTAVPLHRYEDVFTSVTPNLGILNRSEVAAVFQAYLPLRSLAWKLRLLEQIRPISQFRDER